jgi:Mn-dependent DtxR family transcriptional regulator
MDFGLYKNNLDVELKRRFETFLNFFQFCPHVRKIGNLLSWNVSEMEYEELLSMSAENSYDIEIMFKKMIMR